MSKNKKIVAAAKNGKVRSEKALRPKRATR